MSRMRILSATEQDCFDRPPTFDSTERRRYFAFPRSAMDVTQELRTLDSQIGFLLAYGYFRATRRFFLPKSRPKSSPKIGSRQIDDIDAVSMGCQKSYCRFGTFVGLGPTLLQVTPKRKRGILIRELMAE